MAEKKRTQTEILLSIEELLKPLNNLSRYYIQQINAQIAQEQKNAEAEKKAKN